MQITNTLTPTSVTVTFNEVIIPKKPKKAKPVLRVVVDNTKK